MVRWLRWHCPPDTGFEIQALAVWGQSRYLSVTEAPHNTDFHTWIGKKHFCFFQTAETGNRTPNSDVKGSGAITTNLGPPPLKLYNDLANHNLIVSFLIVSSTTIIIACLFVILDQAEKTLIVIVSIYRCLTKELPYSDTKWHLESPSLG